MEGRNPSDATSLFKDVLKRQKKVLGAAGDATILAACCMLFTLLALSKFGWMRGMLDTSD
jgi:hypothetical protein